MTSLHRCIVLCVAVVLSAVVVLHGKPVVNEAHEDSPFHQQLPNCQEPYKRIVKETKAKAILCPMIK